MWRTSFVFVVLGFIFLLVDRSNNLTIPGCSRDRYIDVREDTGNTITCDGILGPSYNIYWALSGNRIGECGLPGNFNDCRLTDHGKNDYQLSRPIHSTSALMIVQNFRPKALQNMTCSVYRNDSQVSCVINIIYPGEITSPVVNTDPVSWTAKASYRVEKVYSSRSHYRCIWRLKNEQNITMETNMTDMEPLKSGDTYYRGNCSFSWTLPTTEGIYTFYGMIVPGTNYTLNTFEIEHPGDPTIQCGPRHVVETGNLTCQCLLSSTKPGSPAPFLSWPGFSNSSDLTVVNVGREDNGTLYTCKLTWGPNATIVKTANYTLQVEILPQTESQIQVFPAAAVGGGVGAVIAITIVIVIVLVVVRRKRVAKRSQDKENINTNNSEEFEGHISAVYEVADNLQDPAHQPEFTPKPVAEALRIPSGNTTAGNTYGNTATDEDMMDAETDAGYSTVSKVNPRSAANKSSDRYAYQQTSSGPVTETDKPVQAKSDPGSAETSQEDVYAVVGKSKKTPQQPSSSASSPNSTDQTNDNPPSKLCDTDASSTPGGRDTELHRDTKTQKTQKPTAAAKPVVKAKTDVKPKPNHQQSSSAGSEGERMHKRNNRADRQYYYENVEQSFAHAPSHVQQGSKQTTKDDDEYNTLGLVEPHAALRRDPDPEYSHLAAL